MIFAIIYYNIIKEPVDIDKSTDSICKQMKDLVVNVCKAIKKNPNLLIGMLLNIFTTTPILIMKIYLMSWLNAF